MEHQHHDEGIDGGEGTSRRGDRPPPRDDAIAQAFLRLAPEPAVLLDAEGCVVAANPAFETLWHAGLSATPLVGRWFPSLLAGEDQGRARRELEAGASSNADGNVPEHRFIARLLPVRGEPVTVEAVAGALQELPGGGCWRLLQLHVPRADDPGVRLTRRVFDALDNGVLWYDSDLRIVDANQAARRMLALSQDDLGNYHSDDLGWKQYDEAGEPLPVERRPVWLVVHGRQPRVTSNLSVETPSGGRRWLRVTAQALESVGPGRGAGAVVTFVDISEQRQAVRAQRESELLLRVFGDNASDVLWIVDPRARKLLYVNAAWERLWGVPTAKLYEDMDHWMDGIDPEDLSRVKAASAAPTMRGHYEMEYRLHPPGGPMRWIRGRGFPIHDGDGHLRYIAGFAEDITLQREAVAMRAAHQEAQERLERIVATAPGAVLSFRRREEGGADLMFASTAVEALTGYPAGALVANDPPLHSLIHDDDRLRLRASIARAESRRVAWRETFRLRRGGRDDDLRWIDLHCMPLDDGDGITWHGFLIDVTGQREAEEEVRQLAGDLERRVAERTAELEAQHREMESFTYSVSHDLKAPLRGIDGYSRLLEADHAGRLDDEGRFFVDMIRKAAIQMGQLIDDLLAYSRVERGRPALVATDLAPLVRGLVHERGPEVEAAGGTIEVVLADARVLGEREGLVLVLRNLLDNAIKFTTGVPQRRIAITSERVGARVRIAVRDNGRGFDMRYHDRIFEIFQRLHRAEEYPGTGVGLAIVRKAAERMHGRAWAESAPGDGATFFLELDAA